MTLKFEPSLKAQRLDVETPSACYPIYIGAELTADIIHYLNLMPRLSELNDILLISNDLVYPLYGLSLDAQRLSSGRNAYRYILPDGEVYKSWDSAEKILSYALEHQLSRRTLVIALGGGVVGDLAGFAASIYLRGVPLVQSPTTLLAQVDGSIGGKTAVNHPLGKILIGTFYHPQMVLIDTDVLTTLPQRELLAGLAEVIKYGIIWDAQLFDFLEVNSEQILNRNPAYLAPVIRRCCEIKAEIVAKDEREQGLRAILNFGHTVGHALERVTNYSHYRHGEAVAVGMAAAAKLSELVGLLSSTESNRIIELISRYRLPTRLPAVPHQSILDAVKYDKKAVKEQVFFVLSQRIGEAVVVNLFEKYGTEVLTEALSLIE